MNDEFDAIFSSVQLNGREMCPWPVGRVPFGRFVCHNEKIIGLTSSLRHPKVFVKEFFDGFVTFHDHCSGEKLSVERQSDLYSRHGFGHAKHLVYA